MLYETLVNTGAFETITSIQYSLLSSLFLKYKVPLSFTVNILINFLLMLSISTLLLDIILPTIIKSLCPSVVEFIITPSV